MSFGHNPSNWVVDVEGKRWDDLDRIFGQPAFECPEPGTCVVWVSGYHLLGIYFLPTLMIISLNDDGKLEKVFVYLPVYSPGLHYYVSHLITGDP